MAKEVKFHYSEGFYLMLYHLFPDNYNMKIFKTADFLYFLTGELRDTLTTAPPKDGGKVVYQRALPHKYTL